jgi:hypothetical protein
VPLPGSLPRMTWRTRSLIAVSALAASSAAAGRLYRRRLRDRVLT